MAAAVYKFFRDPEAPDPTEVISWIVDECIRENSDEYDLLDEIESMPRWQAGGRVEGQTYRGWIEPYDDVANPVHCAVVMDASAWWQDGDHTKGKTSDKALRARRWTHLYRPQADNDDGTPRRNNPDIVERCKATNAMVKNQAGRRRMFSSPTCVIINRAMKSWPNKNGAPHRNSDFAHTCDAVSYAILGVLGAQLRSTSDAADVFSLFAEDLWRGLPGFQWRCSLRAWAHRIARNAAVRWATAGDRNLKRNVPLKQGGVFELAERVRSSTLAHLRTNVKSEVRRLREELPELEQTLIILRVDKALEWHEIAAALADADLTADELKREAARLRKRFQLATEKLRELARQRGILNR
jgi:RNA polymerase sigma-70 factor, ECF subfamily